MIRRSRTSGFTLIELSIVLVVVGLIVGGILVGRDLIQAAQIRGTIAQFEKYKTAVNTFKLKYNYLPGDLDTAGATAFGLTPTSRPGGGVVTHGNELIETNSARLCTNNPGVCDEQLSYEGALFWQDLSSANLIDGNFNSATDAAVSPTLTTIGNYVPPAKLGNGTYWFVYSVTIPGGNGVSAYPVGNYFQLTGLTSTAGQKFYPANTITPLQAFDIDSKIDDGVWNAGIVRSNDEIDQPNFYTNNVGTWGLCVVLATRIYATATNPDTPGCQLSIQAGF
jgi:prepilin-type N-terminal cleavage/methylation domain-containing protein